MSGPAYTDAAYMQLFKGEGERERGRGREGEEDENLTFLKFRRLTSKSTEWKKVGIAPHFLSIYFRFRSSYSIRKRLTLHNFPSILEQ